MTLTNQYLRILLYTVIWWSFGLQMVSFIILDCAVADWIGHFGWGYPWHAAPMLLALFGAGWSIRRAARFRLQAISGQL
jgi:hypothetical protein